MTFVESRSSVWCPAGFEKFDRFVHLKPPQKATSVDSVPVLLVLVAWQLPFAFAAIIQPHSEFCTALTVRDHTHTGVVLVPCRCGWWSKHHTSLWAHSSFLGNTKDQIWLQALFPACLRTE